MRTGVTEFSGERLRLARQLRCRDQQELALLVGKDKATVSRWERGEQKPESDAFVRLCSVLEFSSSWFTRPIIEPDSAPARFRSLRSELRKFKDRMNALLQLEAELSATLQEFVEFSAINIPDLGSEDPLLNTSAVIEQAAAKTREALGVGIGPAPNLVELLERNGVVVCRAKIGGEKLDGVSRWWDFDNRPYVLLADDKLSECRSRFDAAHELGHLVLHRHVDDPSWDLDAEKHKVLEKQAHRFAQAFLLPEDSFAADLQLLSLAELESLKPKWGVSIAAMIERCRELGFINDGYHKKLRIYYSSRGWSKREPLDGELSMERPRMLGDAIRLCFNSNLLSPQSLIYSTAAPASELEELAGLMPGTLSPPSNVVRLKREEP